MPKKKRKIKPRVPKRTKKVVRKKTIVSKKKSTATKKSRRARKREDKRLRLILELQDENKQLRELSKWVDDVLDPSYLRRNGTISRYASNARHLGKLTDEALVMLHTASAKDDIEFRRTAHLLADFFALPVREIYTLYYSP